MPIAHIEKHRERNREHLGFGIGTWLDEAAIEAKARAGDDDLWYLEDDDDIGFGKQVWVGTREIWHGELLTHVDEYEYEGPDRGLPLPVNPDYQEPEHIAICGACSRRVGCRAMPDTLGCMEQRYPASKQELLDWYAKHSGRDQ